MPSIRPPRIDVTQEAIDAAILTGATGCQLAEQCVNSALDAAGVPREGRAVTVTYEHIVIHMPPGWTIRS